MYNIQPDSILYHTDTEQGGKFSFFAGEQEQGKHLSAELSEGKQFALLRPTILLAYFWFPREGSLPHLRQATSSRIRRRTYTYRRCFDSLRRVANHCSATTPSQGTQEHSALEVRAVSGMMVLCAVSSFKTTIPSQPSHTKTQSDLIQHTNHPRVLQLGYSCPLHGHHRAWIDSPLPDRRGPV